MSKADIAALLERVRAATGPDREIDGEIAKLCGWLKTPLDWIDNLGRKRNLPPAFTASLDASVALIERELSGWSLGLHDRQVGPEAKLFRAYVVKGSPIRPTPFVEDAATRPLALLAAFLAAKLSLSDHSQT